MNITLKTTINLCHTLLYTAKRVRVPLGAAPFIGFAVVCHADPVTFAPQTLPIIVRERGARPQMVKVSPTPPQPLNIKRDKGVTPLFAEVMIGTREEKIKIAVVTDDKNSPLAFQTIANVVNTTVKSQPYKGGDGKAYVRQWAQLTVPISAPDWSYNYTLTFMRPDPRDPDNAGSKDALYYTSATLLKGEITLNGKVYPAALHDTTSSGDFRGAEGATSNVELLIDRNGNNTFDQRGEQFDTALPFKINGQTYEIKNMNPSGTKFEIVASDKTAPEFPAPPDLRNGKPAPPLTLKTLNGKNVNFPGDYKGKKVLLYFFASWCGDCQRELPNLTRAYKQYHPKGVEILGISLDRPQQSAQVKNFLVAEKMEWAQFYDGKMFQTDPAYQYLIAEIPTLYLVDGDSGTILASGEDLLGAKLHKTLKLYTTTRP